ncbi:MAG: hypothetical protein HYY40_01110 [Bacteroidetes bacterium]|nr:hypothetical protein [Bacteroidota bacterium]
MHHPRVKKAASLITACLFLAANLHFIIATHYCSGTIAQIKIVVGHGKATCGMEDGTKKCNNGKGFTKDCCKDVFQSVIVKDNYTPPSDSYEINKIPVPPGITLFREFILHTDLIFTDYTDKSPPGILSGSLAFLQVFRI